MISPRWARCRFLRAISGAASSSCQRPGDYEFSIDVDDSGWVTIDGAPVIRDPGLINKSHDSGTIHLTEGPHQIEVGERNVAGGSYLHLFWKIPGTTDPEIIPTESLIPDRPGS